MQVDSKFCCYFREISWALAATQIACKSRIFLTNKACPQPQLLYWMESHNSIAANSFLMLCKVTISHAEVLHGEPLT